jgi:HK97 family phage major capsid protein
MGFFISTFYWPTPFKFSVSPNDEIAKTLGENFMDKKNLALVENLMDEIKMVRDLKRNSVAYDGARSDEKIAQLLMELDDSGAGSQASDELNARRHSAIRPEVGPGYSSRGKVFNTFGEQLQSIYKASRPGEAPDKRLYSVRAALGLSESVPSDSGFLLEASFSKEIFRNAFTNAQIAPLCREVPIGGNSNSVKINAVAETDRTTSRWGGIIGYFLSEASTKIPSAPKFRQMELSLKKFVILCCEDMAHKAAMPC